MRIIPLNKVGIATSIGAHSTEVLYMDMDDDGYLQEKLDTFLNEDLEFESDDAD